MATEHEKFVDGLWSKFTRASALAGTGILGFLGTVAATINDDRVYEFLYRKFADSVDGTGVVFLGISVPYGIYCAKLGYDYFTEGRVPKEAPVTAYESKPARVDVGQVVSQRMDENRVFAETQTPIGFEPDALPSYLVGTNASVVKPILVVRSQ